MILAYEETAMNAWPALQTLLYDGWALRFTRGYTRRSNSINPLYPSTLPVEQKIDFCESFYQERGLSVVFKMTSACQPAQLDAVLEARGYQVDAPTSFQLLDLRGWKRASGSSASLEPIHLSPDLGPGWLAAYCRMSRVVEKNIPVLEQMLNSILPAHVFALLQEGSAAVACGLGVLQDGKAGLFDIVVDPAYRQRGYGERLVCGILDWAVGQGAHTSYLQVMLNNPPALRLYAKLGYQEIYRYWYRVKP